MKVCECGSFTQAAEMLFLSPISVKKQIDALEDELGEALFIRKPTGCTLTVVGDVFRNNAMTILKDFDNARKDIENTAIKTHGEIIAGHSITFNYRFLGSLSTGFSEENNNCIIQFQKYRRDELLPLLENHKINCVFAESSLSGGNYTDIVFYPLVSLPVYVIVTKNHPLSAFSELTIDDLRGCEIYSTMAIGNELNSILETNSEGNFHYIDKTDRNILFNRIIKGAVEIYPRTFSYYKCIPLKTDPIVLGIYTLRSIPAVVENMVHYSERFVSANIEDTYEIM